MFKSIVYILGLFFNLIIKLKNSILEYRKKSFGYVRLVELIKNFIFLNFKLSGLSSLVLFLFGTLNTSYIYFHVFYLFSFLVSLLLLFIFITYNYKNFNLNLFNYFFIVLCIILPVILVYSF